MKKLLLLLFLITGKFAFAQVDESIRTLTGHTDRVLSVAYSPDGKKVLSGSTDETLKLWDLATGRCLKTFTGHANVVGSVAFCPDGKTAISGDWKNTMKLWDISTGQCLKTFTGHSLGVKSVACSPDGKTALSGSWDKTLKLWNLATGECVKTFSGHTFLVSSVKYSPDGKTALSGSWDKTVKLWDIATGQCIKTFAGHTGFIYSVAYNPDGKTFISSSADSTLKLWDIDTGECLKTFTEHNGTIYSVTYSPDGNTFLSGSDDKTIKLWDISSGQCLKTFTLYNGTPLKVIYSPDGKKAISCSNDKTIKLWDISKYITSVVKIVPTNTTQVSNTEKPVDNKTTTTDTKVNPVSITTVVDVDTNIPSTTNVNDKTFVVIIANENYSEEVKVDFAINDGTVFKEYCVKTLGIPADNIHFAKNATYGKLITEKGWLANNLKAYKGDAKAIFYYAGHGIPGGQDQPAYLLPADGTSSNVSSALKLDDLYATLTENPSKGVTVFLDACFSGSTRDAGMLSSTRGTKLRPREIVLPGNLVVFSAASGDETAWPYKDKQHGMFTYYLLKKLQETKGDITYKDLADYINDSVYKTAIKLNNKPQTPVTKPGADATGWETWKLK